MFAWILKTKPGEAGQERVHGAIGGHARQRGRGEVEEALEERLDAEVVHGAAEEDGRDAAREERRAVERVARLEELELVPRESPGNRLRCSATKLGIVEGGDLNRGDLLSFRSISSFVSQKRLPPPVVDALEVRPGADRPRHGVARDAEHALDLVHEVERVLARAVQLVDERDDRDPPHAADLEELDRLRLDALGAVDEHDGRVGRRERAVRVLGEVVVARRVEEVHVVARGRGTAGRSS